MNPISRSEWIARDDCQRLLTHHLRGERIQAFRKLMRVLAYLLCNYIIKEKVYETHKEESAYILRILNFLENIKAKDIQKYIDVSNRTAHDYAIVARFVGSLIHTQLTYMPFYTSW